MRGNRIAVSELVKIGGQRPAILKVNAAAIDIAHFHKFAIGGSEGRIAAIASQQQLVADPQPAMSDREPLYRSCSASLLVLA
jgi:hypothetical protein